MTTHAQKFTSSPPVLISLESEAALWKRFTASRDREARNELVDRYEPFARRLANRYRTANEPLEDLVQVASFGLVNAVNRFDPARGIPFKAFAAPTIMGEVKRYFRDRVWTVRVPRGLHDRIATVEKAVTEIGDRTQRTPSAAQIAAQIGIPVLEVLEVPEANQNRRTLSFDRPMAGTDADGEGSMANFITAKFVLALVGPRPNCSCRSGPSHESNRPKPNIAHPLPNGSGTSMLCS